MVCFVTHRVGSIRRPGRLLGRGLLLLLALTGFGCVAVDSGPAGRAPPDRAPAEAPAPAEQSNPPENGTAVTVRPLVVVIDDPKNAQLAMLQVFSARLHRPYRVLNLAHRTPETVAAELGTLSPTQVVAVGQAAYELAVTLPGLDVYHAGVLDPGESGRGVNALPPFGVQLEYWQSLAPDLRRLGVIGGPGMAVRMDALARACAERTIALEQHQVHSDREMLLAFRSMVPRIDGFVFLPDESVLSPEVILQVMSHGRRNDVQTLVYSPVMYRLGASLYVQPDPVFVAVALIELLADPQAPLQVDRMRAKTRLPGRLATSAAASGGLEAGF